MIQLRKREALDPKRDKFTMRQNLMKYSMLVFNY